MYCIFLLVVGLFCWSRMSYVQRYQCQPLMNICCNTHCRIPQCSITQSASSANDPTALPRPKPHQSILGNRPPTPTLPPSSPSQFSLLPTLPPNTTSRPNSRPSRSNPRILLHRPKPRSFVMGKQENRLHDPHWHGIRTKVLQYRKTWTSRWVLYERCG